MSAKITRINPASRTPLPDTTTYRRGVRPHRVPGRPVPARPQRIHVVRVAGHRAAGR
jgi:hypothetical protein